MQQLSKSNSFLTKERKVEVLKGIAAGKFTREQVNEFFMYVGIWEQQGEGFYNTDSGKFLSRDKFKKWHFTTKITHGVVYVDNLGKRHDEVWEKGKKVLPSDNRPVHVQEQSNWSENEIQDILHYG